MADRYSAAAPVLTTGGANPLLPHLQRDLASASAIDIAVASVLPIGVERLYPHFEDLLARGGTLRLLTGDYLDISDPDALQRLIDLRSIYSDARCELRIFCSDGSSFHPKAYLASQARGGGIAYVGSSNLSRSALLEGVEWNYRIASTRDADGWRRVRAAFEELFAHPSTEPLGEDWLTRYRLRRRRVVVPAFPLVDQPSEPFPGGSSRIQPFLGSLCFPGWGQYLSGQPVKGGIFASLAVVGIFAVLSVILTFLAWPVLDASDARFLIEGIAAVALMAVPLVPLLWAFGCYDALAVSSDDLLKEPLWERIKAAYYRGRTQGWVRGVFPQIKRTLLLLLFLADRGVFWLCPLGWGRLWSALRQGQAGAGVVAASPRLTSKLWERLQPRVPLINGKAVSRAYIPAPTSAARCPARTSHPARSASPAGHPTVSW